MAVSEHKKSTKQSVHHHPKAEGVFTSSTDGESTAKQTPPYDKRPKKNKSLESTAFSGGSFTSLTLISPGALDDAAEAASTPLPERRRVVDGGIDDEISSAKKYPVFTAPNRPLTLPKKQNAAFHSRE